MISIVISGEISNSTVTFDVYIWWILFWKPAPHPFHDGIKITTEPTEIGRKNFNNLIIVFESRDLTISYIL